MIITCIAERNPALNTAFRLRSYKIGTFYAQQIIATVFGLIATGMFSVKSILISAVINNSKNDPVTVMMMRNNSKYQ